MKKVKSSKAGKKVEKLEGKRLKVEGRKSKVKTPHPKNSAKFVKGQPSNLQTFKPFDGLRASTVTNKKPATSISTTILRVFAIAAVIGITVYIYSIRDRVEEFAAYGYPGIFFIMLLANATVILPAPGVAVVFAMGSVLNPLGIAFAAGAGGALGELTGYPQALADRPW